MRKYGLLLCLILTMSWAKAQLNMTLVGNLDYSQPVNDIWGYVAPDGTEYALIGTQTGVSIVSLATPSMPDEKAFVSGAVSTWRDLKTWGDKAYVTNETGSGLMIIDLSTLPDSVTYHDYQPNIQLDSNTMGILNSAHNIYIDENGIGYIAGSNIGARGVLMFDIAANPDAPVYVGAANDRYSHDAYARGDTLWSSDIFAGIFSVYDVSNKANPVQIGSATTPNAFTHNAWLSDDGTTLFTTDERANAYVAAYDVSDLSNIEELDRIQPLSTVGTGVIPHNTHYKDGYLVTSHYTSGVVIVDAHDPTNLVEVANYDTWQGGNGGYSGCWGAYPYLPSGLVLGSDRSTGLYVFQPNYVRAAYLEGQVTDANTGFSITGVDVYLEYTDRPNAETNPFGDYQTGTPTAGTYDVIFHKENYAPKSASTTLVNGQVTVLDMQLDSAQDFSFTGQVVSAANGAPIPNAILEFKNADSLHQIVADQNGNFTINNFREHIYQMTVGKWSYKTKYDPNIPISIALSPIVIELEPGIQDEFALDLGWSVTSTAADGYWEWAEPVGVSFNGQLVTPDNDLDFDIGGKAYVTDNNAAAVGMGDVDGGATDLISPPFDLSGYSDPYVSYYLWFVNFNVNGTTSDVIDVVLDNGVTTVVIETVTSSQTGWRGLFEKRVSDFITPTNNMRIIFSVADAGADDIIEAGVDYFRVTEGTTPTVEIEKNPLTVDLKAFPNPFNDFINLEYDLENVEYDNAQVMVFDMMGRLLENQVIEVNSGILQMGSSLPTGMYVAEIIVDGRIVGMTKLIKMK